MPVAAGAVRWEEVGGHPTVPLARRMGVRGTGRRRAVPTAILLGDAAAVLAGVTVAAVARLPGVGPHPGLAAGFGMDLLAWTVVIAVLAARGTYSAARRRIAPRVADDLAPLVVGLVTAGVCLLALDAVGPMRGHFPARTVGLVLGASLVLVPTARWVGLRVASLWPANVTRVVVVGSDGIARSLVERLSRSRLVEVVGLVDDQPTDGRAVIGTVEDLPGLCARRRVDRVVIAFSERHPSRSSQVLLALHGNVDIDVVARYYELVGWESRLSDVTGLSLVSVGQAPGLGSATAKRALDVVVASLGLIVLSPVLMAVAAAVRLDSRGPVLFRQTRVGRDQRPFHIVKFRTMRQGPVPEGVRTPLDMPSDPTRVTRVGRWLRRSGLDELPQLVNVVRGQMSVVGPRPFVPAECIGLPAWAGRRFDVRPGITGLWQVCGQHELTLDELCRLDVQYATSWSLRSDLRILARTPGRLLQGSAPGR